MESSSLSEPVMEAIAAAENVEPGEVSTPLYDVIDPDALDALFRDTNGSVTFTYRDYEVTVDDSGHVAVLPSNDT